MKRVLICLFCLIIVFTGCNIFEPVYYPKEEILVDSLSRDSEIYQYSGIAKLYNCYDLDSYDTFELSHDIRQNKKEFYDYNYSYEILSGYFSKFCWNDFKVFILMDDTYYVYDIKSYTFPPIDDDGYDTFELLEYTEEEFNKAYPKNSSFDWTYCELPPENAPELKQKQNIENALPYPLPDTATVLEYEDTMTDRLAKGYYLKGKVQIYDYYDSQEFIEKIKSDWVDNISKNKHYEEIDKIAFSKELIPFSDDYYYYYKNDYYDNRDTDFYYGDYFNIFAYDDKTMTLYFYISD